MLTPRNVCFISVASLTHQIHLKHLYLTLYFQLLAFVLYINDLDKIWKGLLPLSPRSFGAHRGSNTSNIEWQLYPKQQIQHYQVKWS